MCAQTGTNRSMDAAHDQPPATAPKKKYSGLIKRHPQDFVVREIDLKGRVADITNLAVLPATWGPVAAAKAAAQALDASTPPPTTAAVVAAAPSSLSSIPPCHDKQALISAVGLDIYEALESFHQQHVVQVLEWGREGQGPHQVRLPLPSDRIARGVLHRSLKHAFPGIATQRDASCPSLLLVTTDARNLNVGRELLTHKEITLPQVLALFSYVGRGRGDPATVAAERQGKGIIISEIMVDKSARTKVYRVVSDAFPGLQCSAKYGVRVHVTWKPSSIHHQEKRDKRKRKRQIQEGDGQGKEADGGGGGGGGEDSSSLLLRLVLRKDNLEHLEALQRLSSSLGGLSFSSSLAVAGVKDKRAITYQYVTVRISREMMAFEGVRRGLSSLSISLNATTTLTPPPPTTTTTTTTSATTPGGAAAVAGSENGNSNSSNTGGIHVGNVEEWQRRPLRLGESSGNFFKVMVRDVCRVYEDGEGQKESVGTVGPAGKDETEEMEEEEKEEEEEEKEEQGIGGVVAVSAAAESTAASVRREAGSAVSCMQRDLEARLRGLADAGFINYFGVQRVGVGEFKKGGDTTGAAGGGRGGGGKERGRGGGTVGQPWELGRALLKQDFEAFNRLLLGVYQEDRKKEENNNENVGKTKTTTHSNRTLSSSGNSISGSGGSRTSSSRSNNNRIKHDPIQHAKSLFWDGQTPLSTILKLLPPSLARERLFLKGLETHGRDQPARAVACLPYGVRTQWLNAYQSWLWNKMATWRVERFGLKAVEGDLVLVKVGKEKERGKEEGVEGGMEEEQRQEKRPVVRRLTTDDLVGESGEEAWSERVVFPLMGYDVELPGNEEMQSECRRLMEEEGVWELLRDKQDSTRKVAGIKVVANLKGAYRPLFVKPRELLWAFPTRRHSSSSASVGSAVVTTTAGGVMVKKEKEEMDVELAFQLPPGSFATVLIRDFLGQEPVSYGS